MNWIDFIIAIPIMRGAYRGYKNGFLFQASSIFIWVFGLYISNVFASFTYSVLRSFDLISERYLMVFSIAINFVCLVVLVYALRKLLEKILNKLWLTRLNKLMGAFVSISKSFIFIAIFVFFINLLNDKFGIVETEKLEESIFFRAILDLVHHFADSIFNSFN